MSKKIAFICCLLLFATACGKNEEKEETLVQEEEVAVAQSNVSEHVIKPAFSRDLLKIIAQDQKRFKSEFDGFDEAQKYYFCAAFTMGAMSVAKPVTASAMVNYFLGLGVMKYNRGIDDETYRAFDFGKNIFYFETAVNTILHDQICENIIGDASQFAKKKKYTTKELNSKGKNEVRKIVDYISRKK